MASSSTSAADFSSPCPKNGYYDVFLSFRGIDTRHSFTDNIYRLLQENKVYTFMDVELVGEDIEYLFKMIEKSRMAVVIYSESFASSTWCLRELEMILQRRKEKKMLLVPIFYKVDLQQLKRLIGKTAQYLDAHISKHGDTTVQKWKTAVTNFGNVGGLSYKDSDPRSEYEFIAHVIARIKKKLGECEETLYIEPYYSKDDLKTRAQIEEELGSDEHSKVSPIPQLLQEHGGSSTQSFPLITAGEKVYRVDTTGYFQKLGEITRELLNIRPAELNFIAWPKKKSSTSLILSNKTDTYVAFKVKKSHSKIYCVRPYMGALPPHSTRELKVQAPDMKCSDKFTVQIVKLKNDSSSTGDFSYMFKKKSGNAIDKCKLKVVYVAPPQLVVQEECSPVSDASSGNVAAQLSNKGLIQGSERVKSIDLHPTKPWVLISFSSGSVRIWNYKSRAEEKSFSFTKSPAKFVPQKHWIVVGGRKGFVHVFDYHTSGSARVKKFQAHQGRIRCVAVHPTLSYVLTASDDKLIKLWSSEDDWTCCEMFEGHSHYVMQVDFNPKDTSSFASVSRDGTIKIWSFGSSVAKFTINAHAKGLNSVEFFVGNDDKLYLLSGSDDYSARVWDYDSKTLVQTLEGHSNNVTTTLVHPKLPIIITGSEDKTVRIWNKNTHRLELVWNCDLGRVWSMGFLKVSGEVVLGCDEGMVVIKIV